PASMALTAEVTPVRCSGGSDGTVSILATGGTGTYVYTIKNLNNYSASNRFEGLAAGSHSFTARDQNGCTQDITVQVGQPQPLALGIAAKTNSSCSGAANGSISVLATGGTAPYSFAINGNSMGATSSFTGLAPGTYSIRVTDANGCQKELAQNIEEPTALVLSLTDRTDIACSGASTGSITIAATGGTSPYLYSIDGSTYQSGTNFTGLAAGTYNLLVKDANQCTTQMSVTIVQPAALSLSVANTTDVDCNGAKNGSITVTALGGTSPYSYAINGSAPQSSNKFGNLNGGNYTITVTDANGCSKSISTVINESSVLTIAISSFKNLSCNGNASGEITLMAQGGSGGYQYSLNNGAFQTSAVFGQLQAGTYQIMVKDAKGCTASVSKTITQPMPLVLSKQVIQQKCFDACSGEIKLNVSGGTAPYTYQWFGGVYGNVSTISNLCGGLYSVTITDANGCTIADATTIITPPEIKITGVADTILCVDQVVTYDAGNPGFSYLWTADNGFLKNTQKVQISQAGKYQLKVTNLDGCSVTKTFNVQTSTTLLKANFLMSTYANVGDTVIVVEVSKPTPAKITWLFDNGVVNAGGNASGSVKQITFTSPGVYNLMLMVNLGQCADAVQKSITVLPKEQKAEVNKVLGYKEELIKEFKVYPNPNDGQFKALVKLSDKNDIKLSLYDFNGAVVLPSQAYVGKDVYEVDFSQKNIRPGVYILALEAGTQVKTLKIIKI
ncbi:T9SS type A sorting domain-containing protein, partial [Nubsella zeaxanthinifaciens]|uniref:T9SS type A sorting domain-containing protein n=1 Tax=Nubsella zeaxanthinifaciens TaxID=392412 RepID=UPI000DE32D9D